MEKLSPERALSDYLAMGVSRSIANLYRRYAINWPKDAGVQPCEGTLKNWSRRFKWVDEAERFDAKASKRLVARTNTAIVAAEFDRVSALMNVAKRCLDVAQTAEMDEANISAADIKALTSTAIDAIKMAEVLSGGVSDRTAKVGGLADEAVDLLRRLESQKRKPIKVLDLSSTAINVSPSAGGDDGDGKLSD